MKLPRATALIGDILKQFDAEFPRFKRFRPGIGPFGEPQLVRSIAEALTARGIRSRTRVTPDLDIEDDIAVEFKIVRPYGDNGKEAENWTVNLLHPYEGNTSLIGDAVKLSKLPDYTQKFLFVIGYEHEPAKISLDPLLSSFEVLMREVVHVHIGERNEQVRLGLVHPEHQVLRCISWELI